MTVLSKMLAAYLICCRLKALYTLCLHLLCTGGRGGTITSNGAFLAIINTTITGTPAGASARPTNAAVSNSADMRTDENKVGRAEASLIGGCVALDSGTLLVKGSSFSHCNAHYLGGALSMRGVNSVLHDSVFDSCYADTVCP